MVKQTLLMALVVTLLGLLGCTNNDKIKQDNTEGSKNVFYPTIDNQWIGLGISYGSYRDGESPMQGSVSSEQDILEDMTILAESESHPFNLIRMYAADPASEQVLKVIRKHNLPIKVMQGAWLDSNDPMEKNEQQIEEVIRLANEYENIVVAVNLGNEIFVDWSYHGFDADQIPMYLDWVEKVQNAVNVPVTLADDYNFWNKPHSKEIGEKLDFIVLHAYAMWNSKQLDEAVTWTEEIYNDIQSRFPDKQIVLGESGWATSSISSNGDERLIVAEASEEAQAQFYNEYMQYLRDNEIASFYFEAFDEKWKGGLDKPDGIAEKNWGLYRSDRSPKLVVQD